MLAVLPIFKKYSGYVSRVASFQKSYSGYVSRFIYFAHFIYKDMLAFTNISPKRHDHVSTDLFRIPESDNE